VIEENKKIQYRIWFSRWGKAKYLSQHDTALILQQTLRRAKLPIALCGQFNPRMKMAFYSSLPVGISTKGEPIDITLTQDIPCQELQERINQKLPQDTTITKIDKFIGKPKYWLEIQYKITTNKINICINPNDILEQNNIEIYRTKQKKNINIRPFLKNIEIDDTADNQTNINIITLLTFQGSISVWEILKLLNIQVEKLTHLEITREKTTLLPPHE
jgi:radical SAM-linked protein